MPLLPVSSLWRPLRHAASISLVALATAPLWAHAVAGDIDTTFGTQGFARLAVPQRVAATSISATGQGGFLVAGGDWLARFQSDGRPDLTFGTGGATRVQIVANTMGTTVVSALPRPEGGVWFVGGGEPVCLASAGSCAINGFTSRFNVASRRLTAAGGIDALPNDTVPGQSIVATAGRRDRSEVTTASGDVLVASVPFAFFNVRASVLRFTAAGGVTEPLQVDTLSGQALECVVTQSIHPGPAQVALAVDGSGRLLLAIRRVLTSTQTADLCILRFFADGRLDTTYADNGVRLIADSPALQLGDRRPFRFFVRADQSARLLLAEGDSALRHNPRWLHLTGNGALDTTRGGGTGIDTPIPTPLDLIVDAAQRPDDRIVLAGYRADPVTGTPINAAPLVASYAADGIVPDFFGLSGGSTTRVLTHSTGRIEPHKLAVTADSRIFVAGLFFPAGGAAGMEEFAFVRLEALPPPANPEPAPSTGGGGGCGTINGPAPFDPTLILLALISALLLRRGSLRAQPAQSSQPV